MPNRIAALLEIPPTFGTSDLLDVEDLAHALGASQREALRLTQREGFPEPRMTLQRHMANERRPQPRPVWDRADIERWAKERSEG